MKMVGKSHGWKFVVSDSGVSYWREADASDVTHVGLPGLAFMSWVSVLPDQALAQRDAARDIAARLEGELAELKSGLRSLFDDVVASGNWHRGYMARRPFNKAVFSRIAELVDDSPLTDPDAVIAEGES